ncbi:hypothetical protein FPQ18DRAFT_307588 [Pyronema domesticum]|nr:hypothetical protein FPQ18DRAFT_307588 [Pyronema domesticum]
MSDPLSVSASIAGLIGITNEVVKIVAKYASGVKSAHEDATRLHKELTALGFVLQKMCDFLCGEKIQGTSFDDTSVLVSVLGFTSTQINDLYKKLALEKLSADNKVTELWEKMKWPLRQDDCEKAVAALHRLAQYFQFSLSVTSSSFLVQTYSEVLSTLEKDRANLKAAISTLENMSLSVSKDVLDQSDRIADILTIVTEVAEASSEIKRIAQGVQRLESELQEGKLDALMHWISPIDSRKRHQDIISKRLRDTGDWFTKMDDFRDWQGLDSSRNLDFSTGSQVFGCYGKPGVGKSIIW